MYGFDDLTAIERDAIETLARIVGVEVTVSLTYEPERAALSARAEVVQELRAFAGRVEQLPPLRGALRSRRPGHLHHLERGLFEPAAQRIDPGAAVGLLEAAGERAEAELVAGEVVRLHPRGRPGRRDRRRGALARPRRSAVRERVRPVRDRARRPRPHPVHPHRARPFGAGAQRGARCSGRRRAPAICSTFCAPPAGSSGSSSPTRSRPRSAGRRSPPPAQARARLDWELGEIDSAPRRRGSRRRARVAGATAVRLAPPGPCRRTRRAPGGVMRSAGRASEGARRARGAAANGPSGAELLALLDELEVPTGEPPRAGAVQLADPLAVRARRFRAVFVCGLQEGEFPLPGASEPFLSDEHAPRDRARERPAAAGRRGRARPRALPVLRGGLAGDRAGRVQLPQLGRGGQPRAALAVHRRRRRSVRRGVDRAPHAGACSPT